MIPISAQTLQNTLAGGMLILAFFVTARIRLRSMLTMFAWQSLFLALFAASSAVILGEPNLFFTAMLTLVLKVALLPYFLVRTAVHSGVIERMNSYLRPATSLFAGFLIIIGACVLGQRLLPMSHPDHLIVVASVSVVLLGLFMLVTRKGMYGQIVGFLLMENGIFIFGLTLTGGMPLLVEIGIFFDVAIGAVLMAALSYRAQKEHDTVVTDRLSELVD